MHISANRLEGSLLDTQLKEVLDECHEHLVTATLAIKSGRDKALLEIRAGAVDSIEYRGLSRSDALKELHDLKEGEFELIQRLPNLKGELGDAASLEASTNDVSIVELMQLCEENALSCTLSVEGEGEKASIVYKAGEIFAVDWNGEADEDRIVDIVNLKDATLKVAAPPLKFGILSWPTVRDDPTPAFIPLKEMAEGRHDATAQKAAEKKALSEKAPSEKTPTSVDEKEAPSDEQPTKATAAPEPRTRTTRASRPVAAETSGPAVLLALVVGLVVVAAVVGLALKALTS